MIMLMNEQTPPPSSPDEPTQVQQAPPAEQTPPADTAPAPEQPALAAVKAPTTHSRGTLAVGGGIIAIVCGLIGFQLGDNSGSSQDRASQRFGAPSQMQSQSGQGFGGQGGQMGPPGQGQGMDQDQSQSQDGSGGQSQSGPPTSGAS